MHSDHTQQFSHRIQCIGFGLLLSLLASSAMAAPSPGTEPSGITSGTYLQTFLGLMLVVALIVGLAWYARKLSVGQAFGRDLMRVVGGVALGPRERIVLVEVGDEWLVIGLVPGQIRMLHKLPKGEALAASAPENLSFANWLKQMVDKRNPHA